MTARERTVWAAVLVTGVLLLSSMAVALLARPLPVESRPVRVESRPVPVESRPVLVESRPVRVESSLVPAIEVLRAWDAQRARAYATGSAGALRRLYLPGSRAGAADLALLRGYTARGLRVRGLRMQLLAVEVLEGTPNRWRLRVTDRVHGAVAVGSGARIVLPRDEASTRVIVLRREHASTRWRVASVSRAGGSGVPDVR